MQYDIIDLRGGKRVKIGHVGSDNERVAFLMAMMKLRAAYDRADIEPELFDTNPPFVIQHAFDA